LYNKIEEDLIQKEGFLLEIVERELSFDSCVDSERIFVRMFEPKEQENIRAVVQIAHGMAEHSLGYVPFCKYLASNGFAVAINDHLGHGKSVSTGSTYGYFGTGGTDNLIGDMHKLACMEQGVHPGKPYFLIGHDMGSLLAREYTVRYGSDLTGAVYIGTCGPVSNPICGAELRFASHMIRKKGALAHDPIFKRLSTQQYNKHFAPNRTENDWISRDKKAVDQYMEDPLCGFDLTVSGYRDILELQRRVSSAQWFHLVPDIPMLICSGDHDPIGENGKGPLRVAKHLQRAGKTKVEVKLYPGARHAVLAETNSQEVFEKIVSFFQEILMKSFSE
jgi:alpha-beta hydrolase superfamily lysophospholipase